MAGEKQLSVTQETQWIREGNGRIAPRKMVLLSIGEERVHMAPDAAKRLAELLTQVADRT